MNMTRNSGYIASLIVGILLMISPRGMSNLVIILIGIALAAGGIMAVVTNLTSGSRMYGSIVSGAARALIGIYIVMHTYTVKAVFPRVMGIYLIVDGITGLTYASGKSSKVTSIVVLVLGLIMVAHPFMAINTALFWSGLFVSVYSAVGLIRVNGFGSNF